MSVVLAIRKKEGDAFACGSFTCKVGSRKNSVGDLSILSRA